MNNLLTDTNLSCTQTDKILKQRAKYR